LVLFNGTDSRFSTTDLKKIEGESIARDKVNKMINMKKTKAELMKRIDKQDEIEHHSCSSNSLRSLSLLFQPTCRQKASPSRGLSHRTEKNTNELVAVLRILVY
jgi:hypothetical protein